MTTQIEVINGVVVASTLVAFKLWDSYRGRRRNGEMGHDSRLTALETIIPALKSELSSLRDEIRELRTILLKRQGPVVLVLGLLLALPAFVRAATCSFAWDPPTTNADGTPLEDLAGYRLYASEASGQYQFGNPAHEFRLDDLADPVAPRVQVPCSERQFWVVTAIDTWTPPNESAPSNEVQVPDSSAPAAPGFRLIEYRQTTMREKTTRIVQKVE